MSERSDLTKEEPLGMAQHSKDHVPRINGKKKKPSPVRDVDSPVQKYKAQSSLDKRSVFKLRSVINYQ